VNVILGESTGGNNMQRGEMYSCKYFYKYELILLQMFTTPNTIIDILKYLYCSTYLYKLKCS